MRALRGIVLAIAMLAVACSAGPQPIAYGRADCTYCRMRIDDSRFGGEIVSAHGKVLQFDAVECMASYYRSLPDRASATSLWVADFEHPGTLLPVTAARFVRLGGAGSSRRGAPMGGALLAVSARSDIRRLRGELGEVAEQPGAAPELSWSDVVAQTSEAAPPAGGAGDS